MEFWNCRGLGRTEEGTGVCFRAHGSRVWGLGAYHGAITCMILLHLFSCPKNAPNEHFLCVFANDLLLRRHVNVLINLEVEVVLMLRAGLFPGAAFKCRITVIPTSKKSKKSNDSKNDVQP